MFGISSSPFGCVLLVRALTRSLNCAAFSRVENSSVYEKKKSSKYAEKALKKSKKSYIIEL